MSMLFSSSLCLACIIFTEWNMNPGADIFCALLQTLWKARVTTATVSKGQANGLNYKI